MAEKAYNAMREALEEDISRILKNDIEKDGYTSGSAVTTFVKGYMKDNFEYKVSEASEGVFSEEFREEFTAEILEKLKKDSNLTAVIVERSDGTRDIVYGPDKKTIEESIESDKMRVCFPLEDDI